MRPKWVAASSLRVRNMSDDLPMVYSRLKNVFLELTILTFLMQRWLFAGQILREWLLNLTVIVRFFSRLFSRLRLRLSNHILLHYIWYFDDWYPTSKAIAWRIQNYKFWFLAIKQSFQSTISAACYEMRKIQVYYLTSFDDVRTILGRKSVC